MADSNLKCNPKDGLSQPFLDSPTAKLDSLQPAFLKALFAFISCITDIGFFKTLVS